MNQPGGPHFFDRYDRFVRNGSAAAGSASALSNVVRLRHRYEALISRSRELFAGARALDIMSSFGFWSLAALDAGAAHVVGLESSRKAVEAAEAALAEYPIKSESYQFINSDVFAGLRNCDPGAFDLVLCHGFLELSDPRFLFQQLSRLRVKHVILDTRIVRGQGPIIRLTHRSGDAVKSKAGRYSSMLSLPNHELITFFCDYFQFRWRQIDWQTLGITDWTGINDYEHDRRRTYVLDSSAANPGDRDSRLEAPPILTE